MTAGDSMPRAAFETIETVRKADWANIRTIVQKTYGDATRMREPARLRSHNQSPSEGISHLGPACVNTNGLGCGDPTALAALQPGETVLDLGSGPGLDCFVAALCVGQGGRVVGIDLTPEMIRLARHNAAEAGVRTVSFLLGEIERLPLQGEVFDVVMSNCVINLCPDKNRVLTEVYRVLRRGGRIAFSDIVGLGPLPREIADDLVLYAGCVAGVVTAEEMSAVLHDAGFDSIRIVLREKSHQLLSSWAPGRGLERFVAAADIMAIKS